MLGTEELTSITDYSMPAGSRRSQVGAIRKIASAFYLVVLPLIFTTSSFIASAADQSTNQSASLKSDSPAVKYKLALPGYKFKFPDDHFSHNEYRTEWWYYTGHLQSPDKKEFGFELTFFRSGVPINDGAQNSPWSLKNIYMTHFALSDVENKKFYHDEKLCRAGVNTAGASESEYKVWTENWSVKRDDSTHKLNAQNKDIALNLTLAEAKPPALHGENGVSQKAYCVGCASHYYSFTRMPASGDISIDGKKFEVKGIAWMDHEFGSNQLAADQIGWDWYSVQLEDNTELMLYIMRLKDGTIDPNSSGTFVTADGNTEHLPLSTYKVNSSSIWISPHTGGKYPSNWKVSIPSKKIELEIDPLISDQELVSRGGGISYWEGTCNVQGSKDGKAVCGKAYVELTGYSKALNGNI